MNISRFFIDRPIFAAVISIVTVILGSIAYVSLPVAQYPDIIPPTIVVQASYPGAPPDVIADTVATPIEQEVNGVEDMLYMSSQSTTDGNMTLTITFRLGTDLDKAQVLTQNRVAIAEPRLPEDVRRLGVTTLKSSPDLLMVVHLLSPTKRYDQLYIGNFALIRIRDALRRIEGVGDVNLFGLREYSMRVWLDPGRLASRNIATSDVVQALREQNVQVASGAVGQQPVPSGHAFQLPVTTLGRLREPEEFGNVIVKTGADGRITRIRDIARIELAGRDYSVNSYLDNQPAVAMVVAQRPGSNALATADAVERMMEELSRGFPEGLTYKIVYNPTVFVEESVNAVIHTLFEAIALVVLVVLIFLQTWRATLIPLLAIPVSLVGTFAAMSAFGFSLNMLSLFGLVLAIGIVVDDAIVVVENVERHIAEGLSPREATKVAMREVSRPIIAITLVLCAVFGPVAFVSGLTGQFYRQFALTIAISTVISAFNSLTLSPALAAVLLKPHSAAPDALSRVMNRVFGGFFGRFNRAFARAGDQYSRALGLTMRHGAIALAIYAGLIVLTAFSFRLVPDGFIPAQDKQYLVAVAQLPPAASLDRTEAVTRRIADIALKQPGVAHAVEFSGMSVNGFTQSSSAALIFFPLDDFSQRTSRALSGPAIAAALNAKMASIQDAFVLVVTPPPVIGLGTLGGFKLQLEDRTAAGPEALFSALSDALGGAFSTYQINVPQLDVDVDRVKVKRENVRLSDVFETLQVYLGSLYVNDFNRFGRTYQVVAQADAPFRSQLDDILPLKTRNANGEMVPLGSVINVSQSFGPDVVQRYNAYASADINGGPAPGFSSGQAQEAMAKILDETLPRGMSYEWTDLAYQQLISGNTAFLVFPLCVLFVFLVLAAQYESLSLPLAIVLIVPMCLLPAITAVRLDHGDNNIFMQIGLLVLVGLACKNAILIVEFAKHLQEDRGRDALAAVLEAAHLRLRPILMTSMAFVMGVVPLALATGAGAEVRHALGVTVFAGMLGVTLFGLLLTPVFYVLVRRLGARGAAPAAVTQLAVPETLHD